MKPTLLSFAAAFVLAAGAASAHPPEEHSKTTHGSQDAGSHMAMANKAFMLSMQEMHKAMMAAKGANVDATFARKMIAHHEGAIAMAKVQLQHGSDAEAKKAAQKTIDENTKGIEELKAWLRQHDG